MEGRERSPTAIAAVAAAATTATHCPDHKDIAMATATTRNRAAAVVTTAVAVPSRQSTFAPPPYPIPGAIFPIPLADHLPRQLTPRPILSPASPGQASLISPPRPFSLLATPVLSSSSPSFCPAGSQPNAP